MDYLAEKLCLQYRIDRYFISQEWRLWEYFKRGLNLIRKAEMLLSAFVYPVVGLCCLAIEQLLYLVKREFS